MGLRLRLFTFAPLLLALACSGGGSGTPSGSAGTASTTGGSGSTPSGGSSSGGQYVSMVPLAGSGQAVGGGDQGGPFGSGDVVMIMPPEMGGMATGGSGGGAGIPGDGNTMTGTLRTGMSGTAVFTQTAEDVKMELNVTGGCADGMHTISIYDGDSCDNAGTEGNLWDNGRGSIGSFNCSGNKGTLTYTRPGADKTKNWTVSDHNRDTDITTRVLIISSAGNERAACGNFF